MTPAAKDPKKENYDSKEGYISASTYYTLPLRAKENRIYERLYIISIHHLTTTFVLACILLNTIILSFDRYPMPEDQEVLFEWINQTLTWIFLLEMILKMAGLSPKIYF